MADFRPFAVALAAHFATMSQHELYRVDITGDDMWDTYLEAFPEGTNPIYRVRTEHDGSYDRSFVKRMGNVVRITSSGDLETIWDIPGLEHPYDVVAAKLSEEVRTAFIGSVFRINERKVGVVSNIERLDDGTTHEWRHFHADIADRHFSVEVATIMGRQRTTANLLERGLRELKPDALQSVSDLINNGNLYRGDEFAASVDAFLRLQREYIASDEAGKNLLVWQNVNNPVARLRNTVIGQLLQDLSDNVGLEAAVRSYERMVAPTNYKRPTALITKGMIDQATTTIRELGLESALERRFATIGDISINNVLWADGSVQPLMKDGLTDLLMSEVKPAPNSKAKAEPISIDAFMQDVLPKVSSMELLFTNQHQGNLMSLTAPVHDDAGQLFKWSNGFAWSYNGNITDSIKEKVKAAGGNTNAVLRVSLAWFNHDDLDLHSNSPSGHVYFGDKKSILDVDMNAGSGKTRSPVENQSWNKPRDGKYTIEVNQYAKRETSNVGFTLEVENDGSVTQYSYHKAVTGTVRCLAFEIRSEKIVDLKVVDANIVGQGISQEKWGLPTEQFVKVNTVLNSPNHWDGEKTGNKHWFFIVDGCLNDEPTRGIYNEFLKPELEQHRKVFEVLGNKTKCLPSAAQLSGLGFSSTKRDSITVRVTGASLNKLYLIQF